MATRYRYEYLKRKREKAQLRENLAQEEIDLEVNEQQVPKKVNVWKEILGWIIYIAVILGVTYLIITYVGQRTRVSGDSMEATLHSGDNLIVDKLSYHFREPERYEIIVFPYRYEENTFYIKRIVGLPGDTVQIKEGYLYINGERSTEAYGLERMDSAGIAAEEIELGEDEYFVLGDNRNASSDSRNPSVGVLKRDEIIGRAWVRIWPLDNIGVISHD